MSAMVLRIRIAGEEHQRQQARPRPPTGASTGS